ncbi:hypothetical protein GALMADRAFT_254071 [Galerina marginata CBS 339.88]|uniref:MYND-type domain-containing protein n=1 Tax=Galerina marginata (strain CBS 339.88) TaxID=685588 RepID=A0A067SMI0_GALM3|nr:hypothetical protein GALMADRAFT_254071 [Galerina marginata CBS 339.88]
MSTVCSHCGKFPELNKRMSKCARCKFQLYCSRQCQKDDWPDHKQWCGDEEKQLSFILKYAMRMNNDDDFLQSLGLALAEEFYKTFTTTPNPKRMWVAHLQLCLVPYNPEDMDALNSLDVPLEPLLEKHIDGMLAICDLGDCSNLDKFPLEQCRHRLWQTYRDKMNRTGFKDDHVVLVRFGYRDMDFYFLPI